MSLKLNERYPNRFSNPSAGYPQGSFKNRTTPTAKDGSYLEQDWANDKEGFFQSLLSEAGVTANGTPDSVGNSQYFDAMKTAARRVSSGVVGIATNLKMIVSSPSATATLTADEIVVKSSIAGLAWVLGGFNKPINLATTGAGGMDTGTAPVNGWVALYAIYNPTTGVSALLAVNATAAVAPAVYGGANMPTGYTASALVAVLPTNGSSQFAVATMQDRTVEYFKSLFIGNPGATFTLVSITGCVPPNAKKLNSNVAMTTTATAGASSTAICSTANGIGTPGYSVCSSFTTVPTVVSGHFHDISVFAQQVYVATSGPIASASINSYGYSF